MLRYPDFDPVALSIGSVQIRWYGVAYVVGILMVWFCCDQLIKRGYSKISRKDLGDFVPWATLGVVVGGRLGHVILYGGSYYLENPLEIFMIWKPGMAFHGGLVGVIIATFWFCHKRNIDIPRLADLISVGTPIAIFSVRIANFINGELWGRISDSPFAMIFPYGGPFPRHPSQLYEAVLEGASIFVVQLILIIIAKRREWAPGIIAGAFLMNYGAMRYIAEFFREPVDGYIYSITAGQFYSIPIFVFGLMLLVGAIIMARKNK